MSHLGILSGRTPVSHLGTGLSSVTMWNQRCNIGLILHLPFFEVREMMAKEGVVLDFSDTKLKGLHLFVMNT